MEYEHYITDPAQEIRALALIYVQKQDLSDLRPEAVLNLYDSVLKKMWDHYNAYMK